MPPVSSYGGEQHDYQAKGIASGGAASFVALALAVTMAPAAAIAASPQSADAQGTVATAAAEETGHDINAPAVDVVISDIADNSVHVAVTGTDADVHFQNTYLTYRKASEPAPAEWTLDTWEDLFDSDSWTSIGQTAYDGLRTCEIDYRGLEPGTDYVLYVKSTKAYNDNVYGFTDTASYTFTTSGVGVDSVAHEISALVSGDFDADAVSQARTDFDSLGEDKQTQVANADVLTAAEAVVTARNQAAQATLDTDAAKTAQKAAEDAAAKAEQELANYKAAHPEKKANTIQAVAAKKTVKAKALKKKAQKVKIKVSKAQGKVTYKKAKTTGIYKKASVSKKGVVTLKKGAKKGTYKFKVTAAGNASYSAKTVTVSIKVK